MFERKKIAYYTINDPLDKRSWSGTTYYIGKALEKNVGDVHFLGPVKIPWLLDKTFRALQKLSRLLFKTEWIPKYSLLKNGYAAYILKRRMKGHHYDFLIAPAAASELACLNTDLPIVYLGDATYKIYKETYAKEFKNVGKISKWEGEYLEKKALSKSNVCIFCSEWAANSAINDYDVPVDKIELILLGANIDEVPNRETIFEKEENDTLTLLFLAVDWERKGGAIAFDTLVQLHQKGIKAKLIVCGCVPPPQYTHPYIEVIPFINKNLTDDYELFVQILSSAHFLILPTRADCSLLVAMEANSYGVPAITTKIGGVPDVVKDGINGYCLWPQAGGSEYARIIMEVFQDKNRYHQLIRTSRERFEKELNWDKWAENFKAVLKKHHLDTDYTNNTLLQELNE